MVIVFEKPVLEDNGLVGVAVMDAARSGHAEDFRSKGSGGVGVGRISFKVNKNGAPLFTGRTEARSSRNVLL